jgi:hypothetical protein
MPRFVAGDVLTQLPFSSGELARCKKTSVEIIPRMAASSMLPIALRRSSTAAEAILQAPEIQSMYSLNMPVSKIRTKLRSEYEKHRYVNQLGVVDVLLFQGHSEFQVGASSDQEDLLGMVRFDADLVVTFTGNAELLEAAGTRDEVLQVGGRSNGEIAK